MAGNRGRGVKYPQEFKTDALKLIQVNGRSVPEVANDLGIGEQTLYRWVKEVKDGKDDSKVKAREQDAEIKQLKKEVADLKETVIILKKSVAIFSKP
ncbi:MAG: transposase [Bacillota bacterium]